MTCREDNEKYGLSPVGHKLALILLVWLGRQNEPVG